VIVGKRVEDEVEAGRRGHDGVAGNERTEMLSAVYLVFNHERRGCLLSVYIQRLPRPPR
jgi:hypothetical protein